MCFVKGLVSCVTPVYNGEKYVGLMLDSILQQTYPSIEMILVDDGSEDRSLEIADSYKERFAKKGYDYHILHGQHKNASAAMNRGLAKVRGEYLIWPDSDDILERESVEKRVGFLKENPEFGCVRTVMYYFDSNGPITLKDEKIGDVKKEELFWDILQGETFVCCGCYMLRTKAFFSIYQERRIPEYGVGQNFQMLLPYLYRCRCHTIPEALYGVRVHDDSHSRRKLTQMEEEDRYRGFEDLIDEISVICRIHTAFEKRKIARWKLRRRYYIAQKYGKRLEAAKAKIYLHFLSRDGGE
ncbi:MAG: glycosyltransferase family 2 protein [Hungatella sp.]|nr:glycosyltransferase family 2 protein [Hungatella sp.]